MIRILSGFTGPGGSTVAFSNLVNLFNENGMTACLYGPHDWKGVTCKFKKEEPLINTDDTVIYHFRMPPSSRCKKLILSTHETRVFPIKEIKELKYDAVHFVSEFQKDWQGVDGVVIPNVIGSFIHKGFKIKRVAGIIGSLDPNKRTELSIQRALKDTHTDIRIYGNITDGKYFSDTILPLLSDKVSYHGVSTDMNRTYNQLSDVYHSPELETFNLIKFECEATGVRYHGEEGNDTKAEHWSDEKILSSWKRLMA